MEPQVFFSVCYNDKDPSEEIQKRHSFQPAILHGYCRRRVHGADYPGMVEDPDHTVRGAVISGITKDNLERLDFFEGAQYDRRVVRPKLLTKVGNEQGEGNVEGEQVITESYIFLDKAWLEDKEWDFAEFRRDKLKKWTRAGYVFEGESSLILNRTWPVATMLTIGDQTATPTSLPVLAELSELRAVRVHHRAIASRRGFWRLSQGSWTGSGLDLEVAME